MIAMLACALAQLPATEAWRATLDNGTNVYAIRTNSPEMAITLALDTRGLEPPAPHGTLHLVEHIAARGDGSLDARLESQGATLTAETRRGVMLFTITGPSALADQSIGYLAELRAKASYDAESLADERKTLAEELVLRTSRNRLMDEAWNQMINPPVRDPFGSIEALQQLNPDLASITHQELFTGARASICLVGPLDPRSAAMKINGIYSKWPAGGEPIVPREAVQNVAGVESGSHRGSAAIISSISEPQGLAVLAAGFALSSRHAEAQIVYNPDITPSPALLEASSAAAESLASLGPAELQSLAATGNYMVRRWIRRHRTDPAFRSRLHARLALQNASVRLEEIEAKAFRLTNEQIASAAAMFRDGLR